MSTIVTGHHRYGCQLAGLYRCKAKGTNRFLEERLA
jgi:hypothetical protein